MRLFQSIPGKLLAVALLGGVATTAIAAGGDDFGYKMKHPSWSFQGMSGTYDVEAMRRGYQVYREVCSSCHALDQLAFRHLGDPGAPFHWDEFPNPNDNPYVKAIAADWTIEDIDPETGDVVERPGIPARRVPPDLSQCGRRTRIQWRCLSARPLGHGGRAHGRCGLCLQPSDSLRLS